MRLLKSRINKFNLGSNASGPASVYDFLLLLLQAPKRVPKKTSDRTGMSFSTHLGQDCQLVPSSVLAPSSDARSPERSVLAPSAMSLASNCAVPRSSTRFGELNGIERAMNKRLRPLFGLPLKMYPFTTIICQLMSIGVYLHNYLPDMRARDREIWSSQKHVSLLGSRTWSCQEFTKGPTRLAFSVTLAARNMA